MVTEKKLQSMLRETVSDTSALLDFCRDRYSMPVEALIAMVLGSGSLAVAVGMSRDDLLEGVGKAWDFAQATREEGGDHVH